MKLYTNYAKLFFLVCCAVQAQAFNTDLGTARMIEIMHEGPQGLADGYKKVTFAQTCNLAADLNLAEIMTKFDCKLQVGKNFLLDACLDKLISPKDTSAVLQGRTAAIRLLRANVPFQQRLQELLTQAAKYEQQVMHFLQKKQDALEQLPEGSFGQFVKKNSVMQMGNQAKWLSVAGGAGYGLHQIYENRDSIFNERPAVLEKIESTFLNPVENDIKAQLPEIERARQHFEEVAKHPYLSAASKELAQERLVQIDQGEKSIHDALSMLASFKDYMYSYAGTARKAGYASAGTLVGIGAYSVYQMYQTHLEGLKIRDAIHAIHQLIVISEQIETLFKEHGLRPQFAMSNLQDTTSLDLISKLKAGRYSNADSFFVASSLVRTFMYEIYEKDMALGLVFASLAEADALHALATTMTKLEGTHTPCCFAQFINQEKPLVIGVDFWNMLLKNPVINSIDMEKNVILTGPNAGGKSTSVRAILQNIVLAQTFGIAAAAEFELTQFDVVDSYINVSDDILGGLSLFATEIKRAQDILQKIQLLSPSDKYFFALDELFTGTNAQDGEMCAYSFITKIAAFDKVQFIYATHFDQLKELGARHANCSNYKINAPAQQVDGKFARNRHGKLLYPYTLSSGANNISVAQEIARDAGLL